MFAGRPATVGVFGILPDSEATRFSIILLKANKTLVRLLGESFESSNDPGGQNEIKSPPGPNLHTGLIRSFSSFSILMACPCSILKVLVFGCPWQIITSATGP